MRNVAAATILAIAAIGAGAGCHHRTGARNHPLAVTATSTIAADPSSGVTADGNASSLVTVTLRNSNGKGRANQPVVFTVDPPAGTTVTPSGGVSDGQGIVQTELRSTKAGTKTVTATVNEGMTGEFTLTFDVDFTAGGAAKIVMASGDHQVATVGTELDLFVVRVLDANDNPVEGTQVGFAVTAGGGTLAPSTPQHTDASGEASVELTLGTTAGPNAVEASAIGVADTLAFEATGVAGAATQIAIVSGNRQTVTVGNSALSDPLVVAVRDAHANRVPGEPVTFEVIGGGSVTVNADALGQAAASVFFGTTAQDVSVKASILAGSPSVTFLETARADAPASIDLAFDPNAVAIAGQQLGATASVQDQFGNPVPGALVSFHLARGFGGLADTLVATDATGAASTELTVGPAANEVDAAAGPTSTSQVAVGIVGNMIASANFSAALGQGDITPDLAVLNGPDGALSFWLLSDNGTTFVQDSLDTVGHLSGVVPTDQDGDSSPDVAFAGFDFPEIEILHNDTQSISTHLEFSLAGPTVPLGPRPSAIATGHLDPDQNSFEDLVATSFENDSVTVALNMNNGSYDRQDYDVGPGPFAVATGIFPDVATPTPFIATANFRSDGTEDVTILKSLAGNGDFFNDRQTFFGLGPEPMSIAAGTLDIGQSSFAFLVVGSLGFSTRGRLHVFIGIGTTFAPAQSIDIDSTPIAIATSPIQVDGEDFPGFFVLTAEGQVLAFASLNGNDDFTEVLIGPGLQATLPGDPAPPIGLTVVNGPFGLRGLAIARLGRDEPEVMWLVLPAI